MTIPNTVVSIGQSAFGNNDLVSVVIPDSVTYMDTAAFQFNSTLMSVTLSNSMTTIPGYTFWQSGLTSIAIPSSVTSIGEQAFILSDLTSLTIPDSVTSIGSEAFALNSSLTSLTLGSSLTDIGDYAFNGTGLTSVTIPASVTDIGERALDTINSGMVSAVFQGAAPSTFTPRGVGVGSLGDVNATVYYSGAHAVDFTPSPWNGYTSAAGATLTFALGGHGSAIAPTVVIPGSTIPEPTDPAAADFAFQGWFTAASGGVPFDFTAPLSGDATAHARWAATGLAATGADQAPLALVGGGVLLVGLILVIIAGAVTRRRRSTTD